MINLEHVKEKEAELKEVLLTHEFSSITEIQHEFDAIWKRLIDVVKDQLKYGSKVEKSFSFFLSSVDNIAPSVVGMIQYKKEHPKIMQRIRSMVCKHTILPKKRISVENVDMLISFIENYFRYLLKYIEALPKEQINIPNAESDETDSLAAAMQLVIADIYAFRNLDRMKPENVETTISDVVDVLEQHGYLIVDYNGENEDMFDIMYADVPKPIMKSPSIMKYTTNEIIKKGRLITQLKK